ncbi:CotS family spore coat protein [Thermobrachium celere]|uniref:Spore coat protein S n=1 Tax=Thermobrachium celere DSM 8682 TaxID=941824 RepID=R7RRT6_9CLOT|nr:CotS family spore coat protein [Thermobrachium celere]CDF57993.1 spore coat protein S [Thermobrachium celere DSM 8682]
MKKMFDKSINDNLLYLYNIQIQSIEKRRSVYKIKSTQDEYFCLKEVNHRYDRFKWLPNFIHYLKNNGFDNCTEIIKNNKGEYYFKFSKHKLYYVTRWIDGSECNIDDIEVAKKSINLLFKFHNKSKGFNSKHINYNEYKLINDFNNIRSDIIRYRDIIENRKIKTYFENLFLNEVNNQLYLLDKALNLITNSNYLILNKKAIHERSICHNSFYYQNIISTNTGELYLIDFDKIIYECNEYDLGKFIQRLMYRKSYSWDFNKAKILIDEYLNSSKISNIDFKLLLSIIIYPHKFWKLGNKKFDKNKLLTEIYYIRRINKIKDSYNKINNFINEYEQHYLS